MIYRNLLTHVIYKTILIPKNFVKIQPCRLDSSLVQSNVNEEEGFKPWDIFAAVALIRAPVTTPLM